MRACLLGGAEKFRSTSLDGLTPSTEYNVRVRGENAVGCSVPSVTMRAKTDSELRGLHR